MRIIVNADDFGIEKTVNERVIDLMSRGRVTSATLIANAPAVEDAAKRSSRISSCSFGVHLNLTQFEPLTPRGERGPLSVCLNDRGHFGGEDQLRSIRITSQLREALFQELRLQVEKIFALGVRVTHFDSHNHVHTMPAMFFVLKRLQRHFGIRRVRATWNLFSPPRSRVLMLKKQMWNVALQLYYKTTTTEAFTSLALFYQLATLRVLDYDSAEVMVHPGNQDFEDETRLLETIWEDKVQFPVKLIAYDDL